MDELSTNPHSPPEVQSSTPQPTPPTSVQALNSDVQNVEVQVNKLRSEIIDVTEALSLRTARSTKLTVAHAETTEALSRHAVTSVTRFSQTVNTFVKDVQALRAELDILVSLANQTSQVRSALTVLEVQASRLVAAHRAKAVAPQQPAQGSQE